MTQAASPKLQRELETYSNLTPTDNNETGLRRRAGSWRSYAAAAGSALALATVAEANTIVYSGPQNLSVKAPRSRGSHVLIDLDGKGHLFSLLVEQGSTYRDAALYAFPSGKVIAASSNVKGLPFGARISGRVAGFANGATLRRSATSINGSRATHRGTFGKRGLFAGVKFTDAGNVHYGWIAIELDVGLFGASATAVSWAYNDVAGAPILAGQIYNDTSGPVPAPAEVTAQSGNVALALLSSGSYGVLAWRRRRAEWLAPAATR